MGIQELLHWIVSIKSIHSGEGAWRLHKEQHGEPLANHVLLPKVFLDHDKVFHSWSETELIYWYLQRTCE